MLFRCPIKRRGEDLVIVAGEIHQKGERGNDMMVLAF